MRHALILIITLLAGLLLAAVPVLPTTIITETQLMNIDDNNELVTIGTDGKATIPNADAVGFSLEPLSGKFPVTVVLDDAESDAIIIESPGYFRDLHPFTKLEIREGQPKTTFKVRLLTSQDARESARFLSSKAGHLLTAPAGAVVLFDIDTRTAEGLAAWNAMAVAIEAHGEPADILLFRVDPATPLSFTRVIEPGYQAPGGVDEYYDVHFEPGPTWDVSQAREVVFGIEVWGEVESGSGNQTRIRPPFATIAPILFLAEAENGPSFEQLEMGTLPNFGIGQTDTTVPYTGHHGVVSTGSMSAAVGDTVRRISRRARFARFGLSMQHDGATPDLPNYFVNQGKYLRLFAYAMI